MGDETNIAWTATYNADGTVTKGKTWNPWIGCHKFSHGCKNCYMFRDMKRWAGDPNTVVRSKTTFNAPLKWSEPAKVFTCSWSDFFIEEADQWRDEAWQIIKATPHLTYQILTKRSARIEHFLPTDWGGGYPNVWLGVTVENRAAEYRVADLLRVNARVHFLSCEPLLEEIYPALSITSSGQTTKIEWVICGGESGSNFRPLKPDWAIALKQQCKSAGVPFFYKQSSGLKPGTNPSLEGIEYHEFPRC